MPLYEYQCDACGHRFELIQKFSDPAVEECPSCGKREVRKLLSSPAIQFKGSGWYITDYARKGGGDTKESKESKEQADSKASGASKESAESKTPSESKDSKDSKPATGSTPAASASKDT